MRLSTDPLTGLDAVRAAAGKFGHPPYLLTVTPGLQPHCRVVTVSWSAGGDRVVVSPPPRDWRESLARGHIRATLLWPPDEPGGYSLILDGDATGENELVIEATRAVLHRPGAPAAPINPSCGSDCIPLYPVPAGG